MANTSSHSSPAGASRNERGPQTTKTASTGGAGSDSSTGGGVGVRSNKGGGEPQSQGGDKGPRAERPARPSGGNKTGTNPGFTEEETKDVTLSSGGGLNLEGKAELGGELSQEDPDHELRGEDQLVDGASEVVTPGLEEE